MLIDGAIVITEYADKKIAGGMSRYEGYKTASKRMFYPILASTGTTMAAFIPVMLWPGFTGEFMKQLPITVFMVLIASLFYSLIVIPVLGSLFGQKQSALHISDNEKSSFFFKLAERYGKFAYRFVKNPLETILWVFTVLAVIIFTYTNFGKGTDLCDELLLLV